MNDLIKEKVLRKGRWHVILHEPYQDKTVYPAAVFSWLIHNPVFKEIPKGYVIHHLDGDPTNDDPSNLALMQKHLHTAHHWKEKTKDIPINHGCIGGHAREYFPINEPKIKFNHRRNRWYLSFSEWHNREMKRRYVSMYRGARFRGRQDAARVKKLIWGDSEEPTERKQPANTERGQ